MKFFRDERMHRQGDGAPFQLCVEPLDDTGRMAHVDGVLVHATDRFGDDAVFWLTMKDSRKLRKALAAAERAQDESRGRV